MQQASFQYNCNINDSIILLLVSIARLNDDDASQITAQLDFFFSENGSSQTFTYVLLTK